VPGTDPLSGLPPETRAHFEDVIARMGNGVVPVGTISTFKQMQDDKEAAEAAEVLLRTSAGLDVNDLHGADTPSRFVAMLRELTTPDPIKWKTFPNDGMDEMIIVRNIPFVSLCNHHVIPFIGKADIGYVPDKLVAGLSKFARVVSHFSSALQVQERLTMQIADFLVENLQPRGVGVVMEAEHLCMTIRGVQAPGTKTYTAAMKGVFADHSRTAKMEFLERLNGGH
jgi:GTP cyclohydrolase IA